MKILAPSYSSKSVIGWTKEGAVVWMYWSKSKKLMFLRMSPSIAREYARKLSGMGSNVRESLNDCSYSAERHGPIAKDLCEQWVINPTENPTVKTIGISLSWMDL